MKHANIDKITRHLAAMLVFTLVGWLFVIRSAGAAQITLSLEDARHLLLRTGFGASAVELNRHIGKTRKQAVDMIVDGIRVEPTVPMPAWTHAPAPHHWARRHFSRQQRRNFNESRDREIESLRVWWVRQMIETDSPQTERLVAMWHNHFATAYSGVNSQSISVARQHQLFRQHGAGYLGNLLKRVIRDPALLNYLDNDKSRKHSPNENLARELLELFTLGEGNYSEADIKNAARALTGYSVEPMVNMKFRFKPAIHDKREKTLFGQSGNFNGDDLIDLILQQPQTAQFIAHRFWRTYISDLQPDALELQSLATIFRNSGYNLRTLYKATLMSDAFWDKKYRATIVKSPISLTIGAIRSTGIVPPQWQTLPVTLASMGQNLFDPPNVAGWPGGSHWITPSRLLTRIDWLQRFVQRCATPKCDNSEASSMTGARMNTVDMKAQPVNEQSLNTGSSTMPDNQAGNSIRVRLASEDFDDAAQYELSINRADETLWTTGPVAVTGGHNSNKLGRLKMNQPIPWQLVEFNVDADVSKFDRIEIAFLNDATKNGADRNLFIDQVVFNNERYSASQGVQQSKCPPKQAAHAGRLYCNGTLSIERTVPPTRIQTQKSTASTFSTETRLPEQLFTAEAVYLQSVSPPKSKTKHLNFALTNVTLNARHWHSIGFRIALEEPRQGGKNNKADTILTYRMSLNSVSCWPDCVKEWPQCASASKTDPGKRSLTFPLHTDAPEKHCHYRSLSQADKALVNTLWHNVERMYQLALQNIPAKRQRVLDSAILWAEHIEKLSNQYKRSGYSATGNGTTDINTTRNNSTGTETPAQLELVPATYTDPFIDAIFLSGTPLPAQRNSEQRTRDWKKLTTLAPQSTLATVFLATAPLAQIDRLSLNDVLTDLSAQLQ